MLKIHIRHSKKFLLYSFIMLLPFLVFYWQVPFLGGLSIGNDYITFPIKYQMELMYSLVNGCFPLYIPGFAGGQSAAALTLGQFYHPISHLSSLMPGYWSGYALEWNTFFRLMLLGLAHLVLYHLLTRLRLKRVPSFIISFIAVYNLRMLDMFRYGASLENYTGYLFLCAAFGFYYLKPDRFRGPISIIAATYLLVTGGHPQMMYLGLLGAAIACIAIPFVIPHINGTKQATRQKLLNYFKVAAICVLCGIILASAYIIPFYFEFLQHNAQRAGQEYLWSTKYPSSLSGMIGGFFSPLRGDVHGAFGSSSLLLIVLVVPLLYLFKQKVPLAITGVWVTLALIFLCGLGKATPVHYLFWKYVPLARNFRVPGRMTMIFSFLFLLILAWFFAYMTALMSKRFQTRGVLAPVLASVLFLAYHLLLSPGLNGLRKFSPLRIQKPPGWLMPIIFWLGLVSLIFLLLYVFYRQSKLSVTFGLLLVFVVVLQTGVELRFGTWVVEKKKFPALSALDQQKRRSLSYSSDPGYGMENKTVYTQKLHSIVEPYLGKMYHRFKEVTSQEHAYRVLATENMTQTVAVETSEPWQNHKPKDNHLNEESQVELKYSSYNRLIFAVRSEAPGYFTLSYPFSFNWRAWVDGKIAPVYRANGYMQAVKLRPGLHRIEFRYWSWAFFAAISISVFAFLIMGVYFSTLRLKGKRRWFAIVVVAGAALFFFLFYYLNLYSGENIGTEYNWTNVQFPPLHNLAYAKPTAMGRGRHMFYAGYGVDGEKGTPFGTLKQSGGWWQVDLGQIHSLSEIVLYPVSHSSDTPLPLSVSGSIDGNAFTEFTRLEKAGTNDAWRIDLNGAITRVVRLMPEAKEAISFKEVEIYPSKRQHTTKGRLKIASALPGNNAIRLLDFISGKIESQETGSKVMDVWYSPGLGADNVAPALHILGQRGDFDMKFLYRRKIKQSQLILNALKANNEGQWLCLIGFNDGKLGFDIENAGEKYLVMMVNAHIKCEYDDRENYLFIQDFNGRWQKSVLHFSGNQQMVYVVWKKIRPDYSKLNMGIHFSPSSRENQLTVDDIKIMVSEDPIALEK